MAYDVYQSAALILRYGFAAAGAFIAGRAAYMTARDISRAALLRAQARKAGAIAELALLDEARQTRKYLLPREGVAGAGRACDVRIAHAGLHRRHFFFEVEGGRLRVSALGDAFVGFQKDTRAQAIWVRPGERFFAGRARFRFFILRQKAAPLSPMTLRAYGDSIGKVLSARGAVKGAKNERK